MIQGRECLKGLCSSATSGEKNRQRKRNIAFVFVFVSLIVSHRPVFRTLRNTSQVVKGFSRQSHFQRDIVILESVCDVRRTRMHRQVEGSSPQKG